jgi:hypothetical protein
MDDLPEAVECLKDLAREGQLTVPQTQAIWLVLSKIDRMSKKDEIDYRNDPTSL